MKPRLTQEKLIEYLSYNEDTGVFIRLKSCWKTRIGKVAGTLDTHGYFQIKVDGVLYLSHRLAWLYVYGEWPSSVIDHVNGIQSDNRICNLRVATAAQNAQNRHRCPVDKKSCGMLGVTPEGERWRAQIRASGRNIFLGNFVEKEDAHIAYMEAKKELHPFSEIAQNFKSHRGSAA